jgi:hypothetical protein
MLPLQCSCRGRWCTFKEIVKELKTAYGLLYWVQWSGSLQWMPDPCNTVSTVQYSNDGTMKNVMGAKNAGRQPEIKIL